ncbi:C2 calcium-dependent membrane targeting [Macleaya cordata]|uniref:C2 calcium-dependent membrane targeting n=1 Tax=Macleaya cordata TaxID=56857 RepID=A0A200RCX9_MACCD|nr:C2 calcium-dependent membrane targeting [Macleaya cordata]
MRRETNSCLISLISRITISSRVDPESRQWSIRRFWEMAEEESEATLKLTVLSAEGLKDMRFLGKMKTFGVAWVDPQLKIYTKTLTSSSTSPVWMSELSIPLTLQTLQNPNSCLTIQVISKSSPIHHERVIGTASLSLSEIRYEDQVFTLQLWRPSGRAQGLLRVSSRIEYNLGFYTPASCVTGIPVDVNSIVRQAPTPVLNLTVPDQESFGSIRHVIPSAPPMPPDESSKNVLRSLLIGLLGGAVAVATVLIGTTNS